MDDEYVFLGYANAARRAAQLRKRTGKHLEHAQVLRESRTAAVKAMAAHLRAQHEYEEDLTLLRGAATGQTDRRVTSS